MARADRCTNVLEQSLVLNLGARSETSTELNAVGAAAEFELEALRAFPALCNRKISALCDVERQSSFGLRAPVSILALEKIDRGVNASTTRGVSILGHSELGSASFDINGRGCHTLPVLLRFFLLVAHLLGHQQVSGILSNFRFYSL